MDRSYSPPKVRARVRRRGLEVPHSGKADLEAGAGAEAGPAALDRVVRAAARVAAAKVAKADLGPNDNWFAPFTSCPPRAIRKMAQA